MARPPLAVVLNHPMRAHQEPETLTTKLPAIWGIGTATPPDSVPQGVAAELVVRSTSAHVDAKSADAAAAWIRRTFARSGVERRFTVLPALAEGRFAFGDVRPGTAARMAIYREHAAPLAARACIAALAHADIQASDVTHLFVVTCTGFHAPGPDVELVALLGLRPNVDRTLIGFMGCYGAFAGLRNARRAVEADPTAVALLVCVELCSIHMRDDVSHGSLVAHALFGDGAAACVLGAARADRHHVATLGQTASQIAPGTTALMGWSIGDDGFEMTLAPGCPASIGDALADFVLPLADGGEIGAWCVHPGGPAILAAAEEALGLGASALTASRDVLRDFGNMSSATILFVLERTLHDADAGTRGVALGFGPGLTLEGFAFMRGTRGVARRAVQGATVKSGHVGG